MASRVSASMAPAHNVTASGETEPGPGLALCLSPGSPKPRMSETGTALIQGMNMFVTLKDYELAPSMRAVDIYHTKTQISLDSQPFLQIFPFTSLPSLNHACFWGRSVPCRPPKRAIVGLQGEHSSAPGMGKSSPRSWTSLPKPCLPKPCKLRHPRHSALPLPTDLASPLVQKLRAFLSEPLFWNQWWFQNPLGWTTDTGSSATHSHSCSPGFVITR